MPCFPVGNGDRLEQSDRSADLSSKRAEHEEESAGQEEAT
jgi:hypothetical protein